MTPALLLCTAALLAGPADDDWRIPTRSALLDNGLRVVLAPNPATPLVAVQLFYRVGSRHEHAGITGMAHVLEHTMFNGTERYGPKQFDRVLEVAGGYGNAYTTLDFTCYTTRVPPASLRTALALEADRMTGLSIDPEVLANELQVVLEERRETLEDDPQAALRSLWHGTHFQAHPYRWPVIGWRSDIEAMTPRTVRSFYPRHYAPNRAVLVLAGDIEVEPTLALVRELFGAIPRGPDVAEPVTREPERRFTSRVTLRRERAAPTLLIGFTGPRVTDADYGAVTLLQRVLTWGRSARLHRRLVRLDRVATSVALSHAPHADPEPLLFEIGMSLGQNPEAVEEAVFEELDRIVEHGVPADEVERARIGARADMLRGFATLSGTATRLGQYELLAGDHRKVFAAAAALRELDGDSLRAAVKKYFARQRSTVAVLVTEDDK